LFILKNNIIDNGTAGSSGNGDSFIEAGETIALNVEIKNTTTHIISGLQGILSTTNPYINIQQAQATYPDIVPEDTAVNNTYFLLHFANNIPSFLNARFNLELTDTQQNIYQKYSIWVHLMPILMLITDMFCGWRHYFRFLRNRDINSKYNQ
jgi:hypothetical protein